MDKKSLIGFILIFIIILLMPKYFQWINKGGTVQRPVIEEKASATKRETPTTTEHQKGKASPQAASSTTTAPFRVRNYPIDTLTVETDLYIAKISSSGGGTLKSLILKNYKSIKGKDTVLVDLIPQGQEFPLYNSFISIQGDSIKLNSPFKIKGPLPYPAKKYFTISGKDTLSLTFVLETEYGPVTRKLTFYGNRYYITLYQDLTQIVDFIGTEYFSINWRSGLPTTERNTKDDLYYSGAYAYTGGELDKLTVKSGKTASSTFKGKVDWTALRSKYFTSAIIPQTNTYGYFLKGKSFTKGRKEIWKKYEMQLQFPVKTPATVKIYMGPLDYYAIKSLNINLEKIMNFGFSLIRPISKAILWLFIYVHKFIPNYGLVLILFSIFVKIILSPLTIKSMRSIRELQALQPKLAALTEKYKNDPQRLNMERMKLFKEHKINPMGGCLPILLQMPILWALFIIFRTTIELRQAPFMLWIKDLSAPDTIFTLPFSIPLYGSNVNVLPIIMLITTVLQQKFASTTVDKQQKIQSYLFSIIFFFIFNQFPSGLNLYYSLFNILTILQQKFIPLKSD
ncbi:MAG: hypothetical protein DRP91_03320 [Candidatus Neomarinimicrobiota bacterium]|nr:MAG: hypothetical protein DRP91_03320 [Candidatus Neomarinimicrobiota bacterium]